MKWKFTSTVAGSLLLMSAVVSDATGRGFGRGGGFSGGGFSGGGFSNRPASGGYYRSGSVVGPSGGYQRKTTGGYSTTPFGGAYRTTTTTGATTRPGGIYTGSSNRGVYSGSQGGKVVYGRQAGSVTTPAGRTVQGGSGKSIVVSPDGNIRIKGGSAGSVSGPGGTVAGATRKGAVVGAGGNVRVGGTSGRVVKGHFPTDYGLARYSSSYTARAGYGTRHVSQTTVAGRGRVVRSNFAYGRVFTPNWYGLHPNAWRARRWAVGGIWTTCTWLTAARWCNYVGTPIYYDYGSNVVYQENNVYIDGEPAATPQAYTQQATQIADQGVQAKPPADEEWQPLGVFGMVQENDKDANTIFQLAMNQKGILRGNYYNALSNTTLEVKGAVNLDTLRAAWKIGDQKFPVFEAGLANLTKDETTMLVHVNEDQTQQWLLVRLDEPKDAGK